MRHTIGIKAQAIGYLADAGIANSQGHAWSKANLPTSILQKQIDQIVTSIIASYRLDSSNQ